MTTLDISSATLLAIALGLPVVGVALGMAFDLHPRRTAAVVPLAYAAFIGSLVFHYLTSRETRTPINADLLLQVQLGIVALLVLASLLRQTATEKLLGLRHSGSGDEGRRSDSGNEPQSGTETSGRECRPVLQQTSGGNGPLQKSGVWGVRWLPGSNFYRWTLDVQVLATNNSITATATASGTYLAWNSTRPKAVSASATCVAAIFCQQGKDGCEADAIGGRDEASDCDGDFQSLVAVRTVKEGAFAKIEVETLASVCAEALFESIDVGLEVGPEPVKATIGTSIKVGRKSEAQVKTTRSYLYRCESTR